MYNKRVINLLQSDCQANECHVREVSAYGLVYDIVIVTSRKPIEWYAPRVRGFFTANALYKLLTYLLTYLVQSVVLGMHDVRLTVRL